ncbi:formylglycine-generating enzyme family protein [Novosphingobium sp. KN65.2]|uniref:formylglycine-generating enzyme family protein n=1 Tax=Novosphingobium sp. KN65.2 TaxID=1478134 RepID=UPI0005DCBA62|nr:formylglycine-generating enzyme family protein [Novosphingobium sp. KN65.2]CDO38640.1 exported hypothetical protein [Novosphingobium sp. KN65.2]
MSGGLSSHNLLPGALMILSLAITASPSVARAASEQVQADILLQRMRVSLTGGRIVETLDNIAQYRSLNVATPPPLLLLEARLSFLNHDYQRAVQALDSYLALAGIRNDPRYAEALALSDQARAALAADRTRRQAINLDAARAQCSRSTPSGASQLAPGQRFRDCISTPQMIVVPGGSFQMGPSVDGRPEDKTANPRHAVAIKPFAISVMEVTFDDWSACVEGGGCEGYRPADRWGQRDQPVINVSWDDAQSYVTWLRTVTGKSYRLPSEAEWEYAARGGRMTDYATGAGITTADANFDHPDGTVAVGSYAPNGFGVHDMHGNVWEWTADCWNDSHAGAPADGSARTAGDCALRVFRGGCWYNNASTLRASVRYPSRQGSRATP